MKFEEDDHREPDSETILLSHSRDFFHESEDFLEKSSSSPSQLLSTLPISVSTSKSNFISFSQGYASPVSNSPPFSNSVTSDSTSNHSATQNCPANGRQSIKNGDQSFPVCHGPVNDVDFEKMVPAQWWKTLFADELYLKTDGDVVEDPEITREEIRMLENNSQILSILQKKNGHPSPTKILDLCCGQGRHTLQLASLYPHLELYGHDLSSFLIQLARERAKDLKSTHPSITSAPTFTVGDCRTTPFPDSTFNAVIVMGNSFGYFNNGDFDEDDAGDKAVLREIHRVLCNEGRVVLDLVDGDYMRQRFEPRSWEWIDERTFVCRERCISADRKRLFSREIVTSVGRGVVRDQFYSERLYSRNEIVALLRENGLAVEEDADTGTHGPSTSVHTAAKDMSRRGQDLGMMGQRLLIFATKMRSDSKLHSPPDQLGRVALNETSITRTHPSQYHHKPQGPPFWLKNDVGWFGVVMGDVTLPCREKLNNVWNVEDLETRQKLVHALTECGYTRDQVKYFQSHRSLMDEMQASGSAFILNLCDEGYSNLAQQELHVPALFEMCGMQYSGAGPVSLAVCYDKGLVNSTAFKLQIPIPLESFILLPETVCNKHLQPSQVETILMDHEKSHTIPYPAFLKPMKGDNSLGINGRSICADRSALACAICKLVHDYGMNQFIVQEYLSGTEYSVGMIGNPNTGFHFLPILEVDFSKLTSSDATLAPILGWESKWDPSSPYWSGVDYKEAKSLDADEVQRLKAHCMTLFERFECRDYARFDWRSNEAVEGVGGKRSIKLLEVNPNPGWCWDGKMAKMASWRGIDYTSLIKSILWASWDRIQNADPPLAVKC